MFVLNAGLRIFGWGYQRFHGHAPLHDRRADSNPIDDQSVYQDHHTQSPAERDTVDHRGPFGWTYGSVSSIGENFPEPVQGAGFAGGVVCGRRWRAVLDQL